MATMTRHATEERIDRMMFIAMNIGWGEALFSIYNEQTNHLECLSDTGILTIWDAQGEVFITAYAPNLDKAYALYRIIGQFPPQWMRNQIAKNRKVMKNFKG